MSRKVTIGSRESKLAVIQTEMVKAYIEAHGGKVTGSVSKSTNYLINNDVTSTSSKNTKAKSLGVPIISEDEFIAQFGE